MKSKRFYNLLIVTSIGSMPFSVVNKDIVFSLKVKQSAESMTWFISADIGIGTVSQLSRAPSFSSSNLLMMKIKLSFSNYEVNISKISPECLWNVVLPISKLPGILLPANALDKCSIFQNVCCLLGFLICPVDGGGSEPESNQEESVKTSLNLNSHLGSIGWVHVEVEAAVFSYHNYN